MQACRNSSCKMLCTKPTRSGENEEFLSGLAENKRGMRASPFHPFSWVNVVNVGDHFPTRAERTPCCIFAHFCPPLLSQYFSTRCKNRTPCYLLRVVFVRPKFKLHNQPVEPHIEHPEHPTPHFWPAFLLNIADLRPAMFTERAVETPKVGTSRVLVKSPAFSKNTDHVVIAPRRS